MTAIDNALRALINTPAPDLVAVAEKLRQAGEEEFELTELVAPLCADLRRFAESG